MDKLKRSDAFLKSLCRIGRTSPKFIDGYSDEITNYLFTIGYISISGDGVFKEIEVTDAGREFIRNDGFVGERMRKEQEMHDAELKRNANRATIRGINHTLNVAVLSAVLSVIGVSTSMISLVFSYSTSRYIIALLIVLSLFLIALLVREVIIARKEHLKDNRGHRNS